MMDRKQAIRVNHRGMSLVEILIAVVLTSFVLLMVFKFSSGAMFQYKHGFVNLQNFQIAHTAISRLRRDFTMACPYVTKQDGKESMKLFLLKPFTLGGGGTFLGNNRTIQISPHHLIFYRFKFDGFSGNSNPPVEPVEYIFLPQKKTLVRKCAGKDKEYAGFSDVEFAAYVHKTNPDVPLLRVRLLLDHGDKGTVHTGKPLELTTSISSAFVSDLVNYNGWHYRTYHSLN